MLQVHDVVVKSWCPNYRGCRIPALFGLNISKWKSRLAGFKDKDVVRCVEYGWPIALAKTVSPSHNVVNHKFMPSLSKSNNGAAIAFKEMGFKCVSYINHLVRAEAPSWASVAVDCLSIFTCLLRENDVKLLFY